MTGILAGIQRLVLALSYVGLGLGCVPGLRMNRATIALVGSAGPIACVDSERGGHGGPLMGPRFS